MVFLKSLVKIVDNSGVLYVKCISVVDKVGKNVLVGDFLTVCIYLVKTNSKIKRGSVGLILLLRKSGVFYEKGRFIKSFSNCGIFLDDKKVPLSRRIFGFVSKHLRRRRFLKVMSLANDFCF